MLRDVSHYLIHNNALHFKLYFIKIDLNLNYLRLINELSYSYIFSLLCFYY